MCTNTWSYAVHASISSVVSSFLLKPKFEYIMNRLINLHDVAKVKRKIWYITSDICLGTLLPYFCCCVDEINIVICVLFHPSSYCQHIWIKHNAFRRRFHLCTKMPYEGIKVQNFSDTVAAWPSLSDTITSKEVPCFFSITSQCGQQPTKLQIRNLPDCKYYLILVPARCNNVDM